MELGLQSLLGLHVYSCTHWLRPRNSSPPPPTFGLTYRNRNMCLTVFRIRIDPNSIRSVDPDPDPEAVWRIRDVYPGS
jgi:hypothetical protein